MHSTHSRAHEQRSNVLTGDGPDDGNLLDHSGNRIRGLVVESPVAVPANGNAVTAGAPVLSGVGHESQPVSPRRAVAVVVEKDAVATVLPVTHGAQSGVPTSLRGRRVTSVSAVAPVSAGSLQGQSSAVGVGNKQGPGKGSAVCAENECHGGTPGKTW